MRKGNSRWILNGILSLILCLFVAGCAQKPATTVPAKSAETGKYRVGLVFDVGGRGDKSFNDAAYAGLEAAKKELGDKIEIKYLEPSGSGENREQLLRLLAQDKVDLVFGIGFMFTDAIRKVAKDNNLPIREG